MAINSFELPNKPRGNVSFQCDLRYSLEEIVAKRPKLKVLDYGSGTDPYAYGSFGMLREDATTVAYDPRIKVTGERPNAFKVVHKCTEPEAQHFDMLGFSYILHHLPEPARYLEQLIARYTPIYVALSDYNYKGASFEEFCETFIGGAEIKELVQEFNGDWKRCFDFHRQYSPNVFRKVLEAAGYLVLKEETGLETARFKFFLIAQDPAQA